jgi:hypothetical protein
MLAAVLTAAASAGIEAAEGDHAAVTSLMYGLTGDARFQQSLLATRWAPLSWSTRLDAAAHIGGHEVRVLSAGTAARLNAQPSPLGEAESQPGWQVDAVRATYRYTLLAEPTWAMKLGLSTNLRDGRPLPAPMLPGAEGQQFGALPLLHLAGVGQWSPRWRLDFALDGLMTGRGRALDLGVSVNYLWSPAMSLYGGYQLTDAAGEAEGYYGAGLSNRANIGLRYRF